MEADSSVRVSTIAFRLVKRCLDATCQAVLLKADASRDGGRALPHDGRSPGCLGRWHAVAEARAGDDAASIATMGRDFLTPSKRASHRWRRDAKASSDNNARLRSPSRRVRPSFAHTAWHTAPHRCWGWSTQHASILSTAHPTERCGAPCPEWCSQCSPWLCRVWQVAVALFHRARPPRLR